MGFQFAQKPCQEVSQCDTNFGSIAISNFSANSKFSSSKWKSSGGKIIQAGKLSITSCLLAYYSGLQLSMDDQINILLYEFAYLLIGG